MFTKKTFTANYCQVVLYAWYIEWKRLQSLTACMPYLRQIICRTGETKLCRRGIVSRHFTYFHTTLDSIPVFFYILRGVVHRRLRKQTHFSRWEATPEINDIYVVSHRYVHRLYASKPIRIRQREGCGGYRKRLCVVARSTESGEVHQA